MRQHETGATPRGSGEPEVLRYRDVERITKLSRTTLWHLRKQKKFPQPFQLSQGIKGWLRSDIEAWISERAGRASVRAREL